MSTNPEPYLALSVFSAEIRLTTTGVVGLRKSVSPALSDSEWPQHLLALRLVGLDRGDEVGVALDVPAFGDGAPGEPDVPGGDGGGLAEGEIDDVPGGGHVGHPDVAGAVGEAGVQVADEGVLGQAGVDAATGARRDGRALRRLTGTVVGGDGVTVGGAGGEPADGGTRSGDGGDGGGAFVDAVPGDAAGARTPAQGDGVAGDRGCLRSARGGGGAGGVAPGPVEDDVVGVVGTGAVPAVEVELGGGLVAAGCRRRSYRTTSRVRR